MDPSIYLKSARSNKSEKSGDIISLIPDPSHQFNPTSHVTPYLIHSPSPSLLSAQ